MELDTEDVYSPIQTGYWQPARRDKNCWAGPTQPARKPVKFVAFLSQIPPSGPFLPVVPVYNHCTVNNLRFRSQHGMEEVVGSIPTRSTK